MQSLVGPWGDCGDFPPVCHVPEGQGPEPLRVGGGAGWSGAGRGLAQNATQGQQTVSSTDLKNFLICIFKIYWKEWYFNMCDVLITFKNAI